VRVDFNVPLDGGRVADDTRIRASLPTLQWILKNQGSPILASHLGRPQGAPNPAFSLAPVAERLRSLLGSEVRFAADCVGEAAEQASRALAPGETLLLENLRHAGEEKNDPRLPKNWPGWLTAMSTMLSGAHRAHASVAAICTHFIRRRPGC
jgi:phosphoglycerate kinase